MAGYTHADPTCVICGKPTPEVSRRIQQGTQQYRLTCSMDCLKELRRKKITLLHNPEPIIGNVLERIAESAWRMTESKIWT